MLLLWNYSFLSAFGWNSKQLKEQRCCISQQPRSMNPCKQAQRAGFASEVRTMAQSQGSNSPSDRDVEEERDRDRDKESTDEKMIESHRASLLTSAAQGLQAD